MTKTITTIAALLLGFPLAALAQDDAIDTDAAAASMADDIDREGERCISVIAIKETHVVDDSTLLFYMRGGVIYRNELRNKCTGLKRADRFGYTVAVGRLCRSDSITVLDNFGPGFSCGLDEFYGISAEEAEYLRYGERTELSDEPEAVELPDDEEAED